MGANDRRPPGRTASIPHEVQKCRFAGSFRCDELLRRLPSRTRIADRPGTRRFRRPGGL